MKPELKPTDLRIGNWLRYADFDPPNFTMIMIAVILNL